MPLKLSLETKRARRTARGLRQLPAAIRKEITVALRGEARATARLARRIVRDKGQRPVSRTGRLAKSIRVRSVRRARGLAVRLVSLDHPTRGPVALWLEKGTERGGRRRTVGRGRARRSVRLGGAGHAPAYPFLSASAEQRSPQRAAAVGGAVERALNAFARAHP